jgi:PLP dependent protein
MTATDMTANMASLESRYTEVTQRIQAAAVRADKDPDGVIVVAVSKAAEPEQVRALVNLGHRDFGENRVPQLVNRAAMMDEYLSRHRVLMRTPKPGSGLFDSPAPTQATPPASIRWHMIGHLQRNKVRKAVGLCRLIHSVDSLRLAEEIHTLAVKRTEPIEVLLQVNASGETQKYGCPLPAARHLADQIETMVNVRLRGVMTMAPLTDDPELSRPTFARAREVFDEIQRMGIGEGKFNILSMGMSGDYEIAIEEGANIVRVGTAIFGPPNPETDPREEQ